ncbi:MAG: helix-turn-helix domain-containing protein [Alphaproteobacteria bacterium]|nr:helix-turn-helix domain-containing protein [Alphaproteobacteria bacterium]
MPRTRIKDEGPHPVDTYVGARVKSRRLMLGLSQEELAHAIGLTFQQVQKYERGTNRISVSRLVDICKALRVPYGYFLDNAAATTKKAALRGVSDNKQELLEGDPMTKKDVLELVRAYEGIRTPKLKKQLLEMAKAMANSEKKG